MLTAIEVEGIADKFYARSSDASFESDKPNALSFTKFIAPLDNLLWDRDMLAKIFGLEYTWEVYVPATKRKFGYYVMPVLYGNRFIARFEPEKSPTHTCIKNWWWEKDIEATDDLINSVVQAMTHFSSCFGKMQGVHESVYGKLR